MPAKQRAKSELKALQKAHNCLSEYRAVLNKQSTTIRAKAKALSEERKMLGERKELVQRHLNYVENMRDQSNDSRSTAVDNFHSELEKQSLSLWKREFHLTDERRMIDSRKDTAQKQLDELNKFRLDLMMKK